jgi:ferredoxin
VDCGARDPVCPQEAIVISNQVPENWSSHIDASSEFFAEIGVPGGARRLTRDSDADNK